jgi:hypothetical protein
MSNVAENLIQGGNVVVPDKRNHLAERWAAHHLEFKDVFNRAVDVIMQADCVPPGFKLPKICKQVRKLIVTSQSMTLLAFYDNYASNFDTATPVISIYDILEYIPDTDMIFQLLI